MEANKPKTCGNGQIPSLILTEVFLHLNAAYDIERHKR